MFLTFVLLFFLIARFVPFKSTFLDHNYYHHITAIICDSMSESLTYQSLFTLGFILTIFPFCFMHFTFSLSLSLSLFLPCHSSISPFLYLVLSANNWENITWKWKTNQLNIFLSLWNSTGKGKRRYLTYPRTNGDYKAKIMRICWLIVKKNKPTSSTQID